jgi:hypothetical protein
MPRRVAIAVLGPSGWAPPGIDAEAWRTALVEDVLDVLALMAEVDAALAVAHEDEGPPQAIGLAGTG